MNPRIVLVSTFALFALACGPKEGAFPRGCPVEVFHEAPTVPVTNVGPVSAICAADISDEECMRTLKDEACGLGADVVWGVDAPKMELGKKQLAGRAAKKK